MTFSAFDLKARQLCLPLTNEASLLFKFPTSIADLVPWDGLFLRVYLKQKGKITFLISQDFNWSAIHNHLADQLKKVLAGQLKLDRRLTKDIGLYGNDYFREQTNNIELEKLSDICQRYLLFSLPAGTDKLFNTWLYSKNGKIFFEVTPFYPWSMRPRKRHERWYTYKTFLKLYEPVAVLELSQERVHEMSAILNELIAIMNKNSDCCKD